MAVIDQDLVVSRPPDDAAPARRLAEEWQRAREGDPTAQAAWQIAEGGMWAWQPEGVLATSTGAEWAGLHWARCGPAELQTLQNFVIEVTVSGKAAAAGLSFGPYKDFLTALEPDMGARRLQLEIDGQAGRWAFRVDGQLQDRCWWDAAVRSPADLLTGMLLFKARAVNQVLFQDLVIHTFAASCRLSVILTCYRFLQRMRIALRNWCHQEVAAGAYEVLVVNPSSPDGTHEHLAAVANSYPHVRVREVPVAVNLATNKGAMINQALAASRGEWIWLTDADCLFAPTAAQTVLEQLPHRHGQFFYGQRRHLAAHQTAAVLAGQIDALREFDVLARMTNARPPDNAPWGYTQIVHRSLLQRVSYREHVNHFAHTDNLFIEDCKRQGVIPEQLAELFCLHLDHSFAWYGTKAFL